MAVLGTSKCYAADKASLIARILLEDHIRGCVAHGIRSGEGDAHIGEVMEVIRRYMRS